MSENNTKSWVYLTLLKNRPEVHKYAIIRNPLSSIQIVRLLVIFFMCIFYFNIKPEGFLALRTSSLYIIYEQPLINSTMAPYPSQYCYVFPVLNLDIVFLANSFLLYHISKYPSFSILYYT